MPFNCTNNRRHLRPQVSQYRRSRKGILTYLKRWIWVVHIYFWCGLYKSAHGKGSTKIFGLDFQNTVSTTRINKTCLTSTISPIVYYNMNLNIRRLDYDIMVEYQHKTVRPTSDTITYRRQTCQRCGFEWFPRTERPKQCPSCHSYGWASPPKMKPVIQTEAEVKTDV